MKCIITTNNTIKRVKDNIAAQLVADGLAKYIPKSRWKESRSNKSLKRKTKGES